MLADQMRISMDVLPALEIGNANLRDTRNTVFMFNEGTEDMPTRLWLT